MRTSPLIRAAIAGAALIGPSPSLAQATDPTPLSGLEVVAKKPEPTPLSGLEVVAARKPEPTPLSGLEVVATKKAPPTPVAELDVVLPPCPPANKSPDSDIPPPKVVSSFPAKGAVVRPGVLVLRVTFDRPMTCVGLLDRDFLRADPCPAPLREPMISRDRRTFLTVCILGKNRRYGLKLRFFNSLGGRPLDPYELVFDTSETPAVATVAEAIAQDDWLRQAAQSGS